MDCDLKLSGGHVIDGSGAPARRADVAVTGDRITAVGDLAGLAAARTVANGSSGTGSDKRNYVTTADTNRRRKGR